MLVVFLLLFVSSVQCHQMTLEEMSRKLDQLLLDNDNYFVSKTHDDEELSLWKEYEVGTGAGNREELTVTNVSVKSISSLNPIANWKFYQGSDKSYLIESSESTLTFREFLVKSNQLLSVKNEILLSVVGKILAFKAIKLPIAVENSDDEESVDVVTLCIEHNGAIKLAWYKLNESKFHLFKAMPMKNPVESMEFVTADGTQHMKLLLLGSNKVYDGDQYHSSVVVYKFTVNSLLNEYHDLRYCERITVPKMKELKICPIGDSSIIALVSSDSVRLYEFDNDQECSIQGTQIIAAKDIENAVCFESGHMSYLAISGSEPAIYTHYEDEFQINYKFKNAEDFKWVMNVPIQNYREESLLLMQMRNSNVITLTWKGETFKQTQLPSAVIEQFDLSKSKVIPYFGFVHGNSLVKLDTRLEAVARPSEDGMEEIVKHKHQLQSILDKQEALIHETEKRIDESYFKKPNVTGFWNLSVVTVNSAALSDSVKAEYLNLGSNNEKFRDVESDLFISSRILDELNKQIEEIDSNLAKAVRGDSLDVTFDQDIYILGNLTVGKTLSTESIEIESLNGVKIADLEAASSDNSRVLIQGNKTFSGIEAGVLNIQAINGVPIEEYHLDRSFENLGFDVSQIKKLEVDGNLTLTTINSINWEKMMDAVVFKHESKLVSGETVIEGEINAAHHDFDNLNGLIYPNDFILASSKASAKIGNKKFKSLSVNNLMGIEAINGISIDEYIILFGENVLSEDIVFENLIVEGSLKVDGKITGFTDEQADSSRFINETNTPNANLVFGKLKVVGNIFVENSINGTNWSELDDLVLKDDGAVVITGQKTFLETVEIPYPRLNIESSMINNHSIQDFITIDTDQVFQDLKITSSNVSFGHVTYEDLNTLKRITDQDGKSSCSNHLGFLFAGPVTVDKLSFATLNGEITGGEFNAKLNKAFSSMTFNQLTAQVLTAQRVNPQFVNDMNYLDFLNRRLSKSKPQNLTGFVKVQTMEAEELSAATFNGMATQDIEDLKVELDEAYDKLENGNLTLDSIIVKGGFAANSINGVPFSEIFNRETMGRLIFRSDVIINDLEISGLLNGNRLKEIIEDAVLKSEDNVVFTGDKKFDSITSDSFSMENLNGHPIANVLNPRVHQELSGPVTIKGKATVTEKLEVSDKINDIPFDDFSGKMKYLGNNSYELNGVVYFTSENPMVENLEVNGFIQDVDFLDFIDNVVFMNDGEAVITGSLTFEAPVHFQSNLIIHEMYNTIDLKRFYENVVLIDQPIKFNEAMTFVEEIQVSKQITVNKDFKANTIMSYDINEMIESAVYTNRPDSILGTITFTNAIFQSNMKVQTLNDIEMLHLIPLHREQVIPHALKCTSVTADKFNLRGRVNGRKLSDLVNYAFMLNGDQTITGNVFFNDSVYFQHNLDVKRINDLNAELLIPLDTNDSIVGNFVFEKPLNLQGSLRLMSMLNGIDVQRWEALAVAANLPRKQFISGNWTIHGNVYVKRNVTGSGLLDGISVKGLAEELAEREEGVKSVAAEIRKDIKSTCEDLDVLKTSAEKQIYKFKAFDYLRIFEYDVPIVSFHAFEQNDNDYLIVNFNNCHADVLYYTGSDFVPVAKTTGFGVIDRYWHFDNGDETFVLTIGSGGCDRSAGNLWKFQNQELIHYKDLGNVTDAMKLGESSFALLFDDGLEKYTLDRSQRFRASSKGKLHVTFDTSPRFVQNDHRILVATKSKIHHFERSLSNYSMFDNQMNSEELFAFRYGIFNKESFLVYDKNQSNQRISILSDLEGGQIKQWITAYDPKHFLVINFEDFIENFLVFVENDRYLKIYEYRGLDGFVLRESIEIKTEKLINFKLRKDWALVKKNCLGIIYKNRLTILEAQMHGDRLDMENLVCNEEL